MMTGHETTLVRFQPRLFLVATCSQPWRFPQHPPIEREVYASSHAEAAKIFAGLYFGRKPPAKPDSVRVLTKIPGKHPWHRVDVTSCGKVSAEFGRVLPYMVEPSRPSVADLDALGASVLYLAQAAFSKAKAERDQADADALNQAVGQ